MSRTIAILGSTGQQGGSVAQACLAAGGWHVRGITRNVNSKGARALAAKGAEMVVADFDDENSLLKAFEDAYAIFCVTDFWQHLALGADGAGKAEARQAYNVALAASKIPTLQHYLFSTLPNASEISGGKHPVPHFDHKARIDDRIRAELPELARKTTFIWLGWYSANLASPGFMRFFELPQSGGKYVWMQPSRPDALLPTAGDVAVNLGVFALAALNHPDKSRGKYVFVCTDVLTFVQITKEWEKVTGIQAEYVPISAKGLERIWGPGGKEMALQMAFGEDCDDWAGQKGDALCAPEEIGIRPEQLVNLAGHLASLKARLI